MADQVVLDTNIVLDLLLAREDANPFYKYIQPRAKIPGCSASIGDH